MGNTSTAQMEDPEATPATNDTIETPIGALDRTQFKVEENRIKIMCLEEKIDVLCSHLCNEMETDYLGRWKRKYLKDQFQEKEDQMSQRLKELYKIDELVH